MSAAYGPGLNPHLADICAQLAKHSLEGKWRAAVWKALQVGAGCVCVCAVCEKLCVCVSCVCVQTLEENGGPEAYPIIKRKVPTYTTVRL